MTISPSTSSSTLAMDDFSIIPKRESKPTSLSRSIDDESEKEKPPIHRSSSKSMSGEMAIVGELRKEGSEDGDLEGNVPESVAEAYPDGGREAWTVVAGAFFGLMTVFGMMASFGAFNSYYQTHILPGTRLDAIAGIGTVQAALSQGGTLFTGPCFDRYGPTRCLIIGTTMYILGLMLTSLVRPTLFLICTQLWQLYLAQGVLVGLGMSWLFIIPLGCVSQWFDKRRGLAIGICISGPSVGSIMWPLLLNLLPSKVGFGWTVRIIAFINLALLTFAIWAVKARLPPKKRNKLLNLAAFKEPEYAAMAFGSGCFCFSFFFFLYFIQTFTKAQSENFATFAPYTLMITNFSSGCGRILIGLTADHLGRLNSLSIWMLVSSVAMFAWMACHTIPSIIIVCIVFGFSSGGFASLQIVCLGEICTNPQELGTNCGQVIAFGAIWLVGSPLSGLLLGSNPLDNFSKAIVLNGTMMLLCGLGFAVARMLVWKKRGKVSWVV
ncbi:major facilitator superfamily domain-containing protein [Mrakia frigida]|uniref:major facilitator superfamily domain-containing protein n=1 Tax=Mrakia frigida TaxID=29902 RepID=UPI003FCBF67B